ncbi:glycosyltransferase family 4 protein [Robertkochia sediminum]|uniref:glycosyltransferase family 4 protein n=1 Tax=Robertkochia sediminum TaxID=2785326 RepID=UPI00193186E7|nr:MraY family glycosyltransferase [Robertkochia sediminum]MBL7473734.1 undecaprenyl/decaprenyl-phosphate alpha-N-acetylglucosaminyl 1-phosphate transferase [Robertkochia sediminum]
MLYLYLCLSFIGGFFLAYLLIPKIIGIVQYKKLFDDPNDRSSHKEVTPTLGGIAFFLVLSFSLFFVHEFDASDVAFHFVPALTMLFMIGLKDDLLAVSPKTKLIGQVLSVGFLLAHSTFEITDLHGFMGIETLPVFVHYFLSGFIMIAIINAYNLIDGIDGLAGMLGFVILSVFAVLFHISGQPFFTLMSLSLAGALAAFLIFNLSNTRKIFMGDTGSMIVGLVIAAFTIKLLALRTNNDLQLPFNPEILPIIAMSILIIPLFDTGRVFVLRLMKGRSPFDPDRNHIHHLLIDHLHLSHRRASFIIALFSSFFVAVMMFLGANFDNYLVLGGIFIVSVLVLLFTTYRLSRGFKNLKKRMLVRKRLKSILKTNNRKQPPLIWIPKVKRAS